MKYKVDQELEINMGDMDQSFFLIGLLNAFMNQFQAAGDRFFEEISWKQCFVIICTQLFEEPPTLKELSQMMGSSHQNVKQMLIKLEKLGFIQMKPDKNDRRKQRIYLTKKAEEFNHKNDQPSKEFMGKMFANIDPKKLAITVETISQLDHQLKKMKDEEIKK